MFLPSAQNSSRRSVSPSPRRLRDIKKKQNSLENPPRNLCAQIGLSDDDKIGEGKNENGSSASSHNDGANKYENNSDNGSEISDEGYRSLGVIQSNNTKRISLHSQVSSEDVDTNGKFKKFVLI